MATYIVIDVVGLIVNRVVLDDPSAWEVPADHSIVEDTIGMDLGGTYVGGVYTPPPSLPPAPIPPYVDPNARLDDGVMAALTTVVAAAGAIHAIPHGGAVPARFEALLIQAAIISDAFVAMLQAQAAPMVPPAPPPP